jgi:hypothetical protein
MGFTLLPINPEKINVNPEKVIIILKKQTYLFGETRGVWHFPPAIPLW